MRVLCVEDEISLREDIAEYLRLKSYEVDEAGSGAEAIEHIHHRRYDLVLCDIKMPQMNGYELLREVRRENALTTTPFLFLSALTERDDKILAHESGCDAYLTKPIDFSLLDATVRSHIERQRAREFLYTSMIDASQRHMMTAIDDALTGPIADAGAILQHLRETVPVLTPGALDDYLATMQSRISAHIVDLHRFHLTLQLQSAPPERRHEAILAEDLIRIAMEESAYHCPSMPVHYKAPAPNGVLIHGDKRLLQRACAALFTAIPETYETKDIIRYTADNVQAMLTVADHPAMLKENDYIPIDATTNLVQLSEVTRHRLVALTHAVQVAQAHRGRLEIMIWPENTLAVRFVLPQSALSHSVPGEHTH